MDRHFDDTVLARAATEPEYRPAGWGDREVADLRLLVQCARAAASRDDLRKTRLLRLEPKTDGAGDAVRATLGGRVELVLSFDDAGGHDDAVQLGFPSNENRGQR